MAVDHLALQLFLRDVAAAVLYADASLHVVEPPAVQLEELQQQHAEVSIGVGIVTRMKLEEADAHEN